MASKILFKDGKIQFSDTGKILFTPAAGDASDCACCGGCTASATSCGDCTDVTPSQYQVTFSGITICPTCYVSAGSGGVDYNFSFSTNLNNTFTLSQDPLNACIWSITFTNALTFTIYDSTDASCSGAVIGGPTTVDVIIELTRNASTWTLAIYSLGAAPEFFTDTQAESAVGECATVPAFTNDHTAAGDCGSASAFGETAGYGGSATVVCL